MAEKVLSILQAKAYAPTLHEEDKTKHPHSFVMKLESVARCLPASSSLHPRLRNGLITIWFAF
jgi:hypothetical protein